MRVSSVKRTSEKTTSGGGRSGTWPGVPHCTVKGASTGPDTAKWMVIGLGAGRIEKRVAIRR